MLDFYNSSWEWDSDGEYQEDGLLHYDKVRQTHAVGCYRVFEVGDTVILSQDEDKESIKPQDVYIAHIVDLFEDPSEESVDFEHMKVCFRWFYWNGSEVDDNALMKRDQLDDSTSELKDEDFFLSDKIEEIPNSVMTIVGRALLCPAMHELQAYKSRLAEGRERTQALLESREKTMLEYTDNDSVYLARWFYAQDEPDLPPGGKLIALPKGALDHLLSHPTQDDIYHVVQKRIRKAEQQVLRARKAEQLVASARKAEQQPVKRAANVMRPSSGGKPAERPKVGVREKLTASRKRKEMPAERDGGAVKKMRKSTTSDDTDVALSASAGTAYSLLAIPRKSSAGSSRGQEKMAPTEAGAGKLALAASDSKLSLKTPQLKVPTKTTSPKLARKESPKPLGSKPLSPRLSAKAPTLKPSKTSKSIVKLSKPPKSPPMKRLKAPSPAREQLAQPAESAEEKIAANTATGKDEPAAVQEAAASNEMTGLLASLGAARATALIPQMWALLVRQFQSITQERGGLDRISGSDYDLALQRAKDERRAETNPRSPAIAHDPAGASDQAGASVE